MIVVIVGRVVYQWMKYRDRARALEGLTVDDPGVYLPQSDNDSTPEQADNNEDVDEPPHVNYFQNPYMHDESSPPPNCSIQSDMPESSQSTNTPMLTSSLQGSMGLSLFRSEGVSRASDSGPNLISVPENGFRCDCESGLLLFS